MKSAIDFKKYFELLSIQHKEIKQFFYADYEDILDAEKSNIEYPCLWLESPDIPFIGDSDSFTCTYKSSFVILMHSALEQRDRRNYNMVKTQQIATDIIKKMNCDQEAHGINFKIQSVVLYPLPSNNPDNCQGWRADFELQPTSQSTNFQEQFNTAFNDLIKFEFQFTAVKNGALHNLSIESNLDPDISNFDYRWRWYDGIKWTEETNDPDPTFDITTNRLYVELIIENEGHTLTASAFSENLDEVMSVTSIALKYNPFE